MCFAAYNELRLLGYSPDEACRLASSGEYKPQGMYEQKFPQTDNGSHTARTRVIGLKPEFKALVMELV
jgi:hypothetical protein